MRAPAAKVEKNTVTDSLYAVENWGPLDPKKVLFNYLKNYWTIIVAT